MKLGTYVFLCAAVLTLYKCVVVLASVGRRVCVLVLKWVRMIGAEQSLSCDVQHLGIWLCRQGDYLAVEMTHSITSTLLTICTKIRSSP